MEKGERRRDREQGMEGTVQCQGWDWLQGSLSSMVTGIFLFCKVKTPPRSQTWLWLPSTVDIPEANITYYRKGHGNMFYDLGGHD